MLTKKFGRRSTTLYNVAGALLKQVHEHTYGAEFFARMKSAMAAASQFTLRQEILRITQTVSDVRSTVAPI